MSADFWAGYISGAVGIVIGNPLDILKVRLQARSSPGATNIASAPPAGSHPSIAPQQSLKSLALLRNFSTGTAAPILGYGGLNALLFVSYNRSEALLNHILSPGSSPPSASGSTTGSNLWTTFVAGAIGGLATWVISTPTELIKCRAQLATSPAEASSWPIAKQIWLTEGGMRGLYFGGAVTALRDSIGYGFYFWSYELSTRWMNRWLPEAHGNSDLGASFNGAEAAKVLLCGGLAGIVTWASIFPLDVIKTRVQAQAHSTSQSSASAATHEGTPLLASEGTKPAKRMGAIEVAREAYREGGMRVFFRGLAVCSVRAFIVNAVQWATYEWIMLEMGQGRKDREVLVS